MLLVLIFVGFVTELPTEALERSAPYRVSSQTGYNRPTVCHQFAAIFAYLPETLPVDALLLQVSERSIYKCVEIGEFLGGNRNDVGLFHQENRMPISIEKRITNRETSTTHADKFHFFFSCGRGGSGSNV